MEVEISENKVIIQGKAYVADNIKVTLKELNKYRGNTYLIFLIFVYILLSTLMFESLKQIYIATYFLPLLAIYTISFTLLFTKILFKYFINYATISLGDNRNIGLRYSRERRPVIDKIISIAGKVFYVFKN